MLEDCKGSVLIIEAVYNKCSCSCLHVYKILIEIFVNYFKINPQFQQMLNVQRTLLSKRLYLCLLHGCQKKIIIFLNKNMKYMLLLRTKCSLYNSKYIFLTFYPPISWPREELIFRLKILVLGGKKCMTYALSGECIGNHSRLNNVIGLVLRRTVEMCPVDWIVRAKIWLQVKQVPIAT